MARWVYETLRVPAEDVEREVLDHVGHGWLLVTDAVNVPARQESTLVFKRALTIVPEHRHSIFAAFDDDLEQV